MIARGERRAGSYEALVLAGAFLTSQSFCADIPARAPVPSSPYLPIVYRYADAMIERGRDTYGPQKTGLFLSALDRAALAPLTNRPSVPAGVREGDRVGPKNGALTGANPQHDENLLRLLYTLSELSGKPKYRDAADAELKWFLSNAQAPVTHLLPWGEHLAWDVMKDAPAVANGEEHGTHEFFRPWMLWSRCFELAPGASKQFALGLWEHQIANRHTGAFDRHAGFAKHGARDGMDFPRHAGFYIRTWAAAYAHTGEEQFLKSIGVLLERFERKRHTQTGLIEAHTGNTNSWIGSTLSLAIDCDGAAHHVPEPLASRLRAFAAREDQIFCALPHNFTEDRGFLIELNKADGKALDRRTPLWTGRYGGSTTAQVALMCVSRYENSGKVAYRELIRAAADAYLKSQPEPVADAWPATFGHAISLQLSAWRSSADAKYLEGARRVADLAVKNFFDKGPLPRASVKSDHYETITGADTLAIALVELHLHVLHITAVRWPPNTIDR